MIKSSFLTYCFALILTILASPLFGQGDDPLKLTDDQLNQPLTISFLNQEENEDPEVSPKKKKRKKNVFYGLKAKKFFVKTGVGDRAIFETFYYLREPVKPDPYVRDFFWYDFESKRIKNNKNISSKGVVLHGPYERFRADGTVLDSGIYFKGTKHGRWTKFDNNNILQDKRKYFKGWPKESIVTYYDKDRTQLKEVIPVEFGVKEGNYFLFHDNGAVAVSGEFQNDERVNVWREFYKFRRRKKKEVQFRKNSYDEDFDTYTIKEWNEKGDLIYDNSAYERKIN